MKKYIILLSVLMLLLVGCSPKLSKKFYTNPEDILFQQWCSFLPDGYSGLTSLSGIYSGLLAIVENEFIFDVSGGGRSNRPFMPIISPFQIHKKQIMKIVLSEKLTFGAKTITIKTYIGDYCFYIKSADADEIYEIITNWHKTDNN